MAKSLAEMIRDTEKHLEHLRRMQAEQSRMVARVVAVDPVYVEMEEGDCTETLLNMTEWVKLIRDVVDEVLEERGLA